MSFFAYAAFVMAFLAGFGLGGLIVGYYWMRSDKTGALPGLPRGQVFAPPPTAEEQVSRLGVGSEDLIPEDVLERGTQDLLKQAKDEGIPLSYEEAREQASYLILQARGGGGVLPEGE